MSEEKIKYVPEVCECCQQSTTYLLAIDKGTVEIVKAIARFIGTKGINAVHPRKEMEGTLLTSNQVGNLSRPRFHGLIASLEGESGNYVLTTKGSDFLRGKVIPKYAIISKSEGRQIGYFEPEKHRVSIHNFNNLGQYWEGINYEITEGRVLQKLYGAKYDKQPETNETYPLL